MISKILKNAIIHTETNNSVIVINNDNEDDDCDDDDDVVIDNGNENSSSIISSNSSSSSSGIGSAGSVITSSSSSGYSTGSAGAGGGSVGIGGDMIEIREKNNVHHLSGRIYHNHHNNNSNNNNNNNIIINNNNNNNNKYDSTRLRILHMRDTFLNQQHSSLNPALRARFDEEIDRLYNVAPDSFEDSNSMEPVSNHYPVESRQLSANSAEAIKSRKNKEDKYCGVCGDRALGYNFDAISCESCKAFFRRNAPKGLDYFKCPYEEKCKMDVSNRRFCKKCRLRKCFEIGMRKEYILTEEEKMRKRQRIEENRKIREIEKQKMQSGDVSTTQNRLRMLESDEHSMISEVIGAYRQSLEISVESSYSRNNPSVIDLVNIAELSVRRVIDMAKKIKSFKALSQSDQISLLKGGSIELLIIRSVINFDRDKQQFLDPYDKDSNAMTTEQLKLGEGTLFDDHMKFVKSLAVDLRADETVLIILLVISLFSPDRPNVIDKSYVWREQDKYALLLQHYLESKFPYHLAHAMYPKLLMKLVEIRNLNEEHSQVLLKVNPEGIQPLMKEVLDLNLPKTNNK